MSPQVMDMAGQRAMTHQPTGDPAMNPIMMSSTQWHWLMLS